MGPLTVVFIQPALRYFPCFIQCSEQIKIQYFGPVRSVKPFDKCVLRRLTWLDKLQHYAMLLSPLCQSQRYQFRAVIHPHFQRISTVCHYFVQNPNNALCRDIQVNFDGESLAVKIIDDVESPKTSAACQRVVHKINRPTLVKCFRRGQRSRVAHRQALFTLTTKIQFQQTVNPVYALVVPDVPLPAKHLKKLLKSVAGIAFSCLSQPLDHRFITSRIRLISIHRPAQR